MKTIRIGFAPTRRSIFSAPAAVEYANYTRTRLNELNIEFVDIEEIAEDGLLHDDRDRLLIQEKFLNEKIDGLFIPHGNFGTEYEVARLAKALNVPVLLWAPRDERPDENGIRQRDSQCGVFATGKVLRRFGVAFTYLCSCSLDDPEFERGIRNFLAVCNVVRTFRQTRILQIGPRPFDFWSTMCNEGELLERFNIQLSPVPIPELTAAMKAASDEETALVLAQIRQDFHVRIPEKSLEQVARLKIAIQSLADQYGCNAAAIQCWNALQNEIGIMPCAANSLLNEEGFPVVCETDIHGAITAAMAEAASMEDNRTFFADWTVRHPDNDNAELLQHCGPWPKSCLASKPVLGYPLAFEHPGAVEAKARDGGNLTLCRFDGDNGQYSMLMGHAKSVEGPYTKGTYMWVEVENWKRLEAKIVEGPYIHHCVGIHEDIVPILYEACKYLQIQPDLYDSTEEEVRAWIHGE